MGDGILSDRRRLKQKMFSLLINVLYRHCDIIHFSEIGRHYYLRVIIELKIRCRLIKCCRLIQWQSQLGGFGIKKIIAWVMENLLFAAVFPWTRVYLTLMHLWSRNTEHIVSWLPVPRGLTITPIYTVYGKFRLTVSILDWIVPRIQDAVAMLPLKVSHHKWRHPFHKWALPKQLG